MVTIETFTGKMVRREIKTHRRWTVYIHFSHQTFWCECECMFSCLCSSTYKMHMRTSLVVQGLNVCALNARGLGSNPGQGTRSQMPKLRGCVPQLRPSTVKNTEKKMHVPVCSYIFCTRMEIHSYSKQRRTVFILPSLFSMQLPLCHLLNILKHML